MKKKSFWKQPREKKVFQVTVNMPKGFDKSFLHIALIGMMVEVVQIEELK